MSDAYAVIAEALEMLSGYGPDLGNGFTNHAPMVVEALCARPPELRAPTLEGYRARMLPRPAATSRFAPTNGGPRSQTSSASPIGAPFSVKSCGTTRGARSCGAGPPAWRRACPPRRRTA